MPNGNYDIWIEDPEGEIFSDSVNLDTTYKIVLKPSSEDGDDEEELEVIIGGIDMDTNFYLTLAVISLPVIAGALFIINRNNGNPIYRKKRRN